MSDQPPGAVRRTRRLVAVGFGVLAGAVVALVALAFLWPVATSEARDLPVGVVGAQLSDGVVHPVDPTTNDTPPHPVPAHEEPDG